MKKPGSAYPPAVHETAGAFSQDTSASRKSRTENHSHAGSQTPPKRAASRSVRQQSPSRAASRSRRHAHRAASVPALTRPAGAPDESKATTSGAQTQYGLFPDVATPVQKVTALAPLASSETGTRELWLACHLTQIAFEAIARLNPEPCFDFAPVVVHDGHHRQPTVIACNEQAMSHGLSPGMRLGVAHSLVAGLHARMRDADSENNAVEMLAKRSLRFSSAVAIGTNNMMLLEVGGSRRLFSDLNDLTEQYTNAINQCGFTHNLAIAPTPGAAALLSEHTPGTIITDRDMLRSTLSRLPISSLALSRRIHGSLSGMGLGVIGDLTRMPRDGLARRAGPELIKKLDQLLGHRPDPRNLFRPGQYFFSRLSFTDEIQNQSQLMQVVEKLLQQLDSMLEIHSSGVHQLHWVFEYHGSSPTRMTLNLSKPERNAQHLCSLMNTRTESLQLNEPVHTISLKSSLFEKTTASETELFPEIGLENKPRFDLIDRLRARLGDESIESLELIPDHRPESAWRSAIPGACTTDSYNCVLPQRPPWLLRKPRSIAVRNGQPWINGALKIIQGPERIETGWWESASVRRDYFVSLTSNGRRLWIFHDIRTDHWFIHGIFL